MFYIKWGQANIRFDLIVNKGSTTQSGKIEKCSDRGKNKRIEYMSSVDWGGFRQRNNKMEVFFGIVLFAFIIMQCKGKDRYNFFHTFSGVV